MVICKETKYHSIPLNDINLNIKIYNIENHWKLWLYPDCTGSGYCIDTANEIASEHMEIVTANPFEVMTKIKNAGAIFLGEYSSEPLGDYFAGPNHVLPTNGTAKFFLRTFRRRFCQEVKHRILFKRGTA